MLSISLLILQCENSLTGEQKKVIHDHFTIFHTLKTIEDCIDVDCHIEGDIFNPIGIL